MKFTSYHIIITELFIFTEHKKQRGKKKENIIYTKENYSTTNRKFIHAKLYRLIEFQ